MKKFTVIILVLVFAITAFADQAAYIHKNDAMHAVNLLKESEQVKHFCNPCDDHTVRTDNIGTLESAFTNYENFWEVKINGAGVDLAYLYYIDATGKWRNVAERIGLKVFDVPKYLPDDIN